VQIKKPSLLLTANQKVSVMQNQQIPQSAFFAPFFRLNHSVSASDRNHCTLTYFKFKQIFHDLPIYKMRLYASVEAQSDSLLKLESASIEADRFRTEFYVPLQKVIECLRRGIESFRPNFTMPLLRQITLGKGLMCL
jgi:hypothetical protein